jgi:hypothetical protein
MKNRGCPISRVFFAREVGIFDRACRRGASRGKSHKMTGQPRRGERDRCVLRSISNRLSDAGRARFSQTNNKAQPRSKHSVPPKNLRNPPPARLPRENDFSSCTIFGQGAVHGVHSIENTCSYKCVFSIDEKNRRSTTRSFFDSFLSFSGWCGVRGSSVVTVLIARLGWRARKGL